MRKRRIIPFMLGLGFGTLLGFILRNSETTDYNAGYQPNIDVFDEGDYFTDNEILKHAEEYKAHMEGKKKDADC